MFTGGINFVKSQRNKRLMVHVNKKGEVIAKVPHRLSIASAKEILSKQADFVEKFVQKQLNKLAKKTTTIDLFATYNILGKIVAFSPQHDLFSVPFLQSSQPIDITIQHNDSNTKEQFLHTISQLAKPILTERCSFLAKEHNIIYNKISIKLVKTIWGSCSRNNNITLSLKLALAPQHIIDYVILHELAHTKHKNHSQQFWQFTNQLCGSNAKILDKQLRQLHHPLFAFFE